MVSTEEFNIALRKRLKDTSVELTCKKRMTKAEAYEFLKGKRFKATDEEFITIWAILSFCGYELSPCCPQRITKNDNGIIYIMLNNYGEMWWLNTHIKCNIEAKDIYNIEFIH